MRAFLPVVIAAFAALAPLAPAHAQGDTTIADGISLYGDLKYRENFTHFDYVNPDAPKGGTIRQYTVGTSFDGFNPFILQGVAASGSGFLFDTLTVRSEDEPESAYGLVAESIELPKDRSWVIYHLRKEARFNDGTPITADDVIWTFDTLKEKGHPRFRLYYADVLKAEKLDDYTVKFVFRSNENRELASIVGEMPVLSKAYFATHQFDRASLEAPLGSGPYKVESYEPGRSVTYRRVPTYWGANLAVNKGRNNFDVVRIIYYRDRSASLEGFKAGDYDLRLEYTARDWMEGYDSPALRAGLIKKEVLTRTGVRPLQAYAFNTRRAIFKDRRVREALGYALDFEWTNKTYFYGLYDRSTSYFGSSEFAATGLPEGEELKILEKYRGGIPDEVFTKVYEPPKTDGSGNNRENLKKALELLQQAGWSVKDGKLVDAKGQPFVFEILLQKDSAFERITLPFIRNLERLGITASIRGVDDAQYVKRVETFDFDMTTVVLAQSTSPGNEQREFWTSEAADTPQSENYMGIRDPVIDELVDRIIAAPDRASLVPLVRALDRILSWGYYVIPEWYDGHYRLAYWDKFGKPATLPKYGLGLDTWWLDPARAETLEKKRAEIGR
ncbi:MAG TPA: extracellular solute-binding protein [Stellaceae bacterium]|nr:extracellular solute-binding protein [Stellaceae bacterium]